MDPTFCTLWNILSFKTYEADKITSSYLIVLINLFMKDDKWKSLNFNYTLTDKWSPFI